MNSQWVIKNQIQLLYTFCFLILSFLFGVLWAIVLLITVELVENNLEFDINIDHSEDLKVTKKTRSQRKYSVDQGFSSVDSGLGLQSEDIMFGNEEKQRRRLNENQGELRPSLMSLIKHGNKTYNKENRIQDRHQPLLAVVKNNLHMRRHSEMSHMSKSPLYKNLIPNSGGRNSPFNAYKSPSSAMMSPRMHSTSGWYQNSPAQPFTPPVMSPSVSFNRSSVYDQQNFPSPDLNNSATGLEVHGSYFLNKSLLHSNLAEDETFSLVNSKFNSPRQVSSPFAVNDASARRTTKSSLDETSTEAVVSILKEKSKRKRAIEEEPYEDEQHDEGTRKKKVRYDPMNDTLDDLFPPTNTQKRKRLPKTTNVIITKKRLSTVGTQYENDDSGKQSSNVLHTSKSKKTKYGLSEEQTNEMMSEEREESPHIQQRSSSIRRSLESEELEHAVNHVKDTLAKYKKENKKQKVIFTPDTSQIECDGEEINYETPLKQNATLQELKSHSTALKSLKSPYKKIFHSFPSNLACGSVEKRRKHPVYFTAKIDVDDIQSHREEYGDRGASLKAFRLDQEEAKQRVDSIFGDDEVDFQKDASKGSTLATVPSIASTFAAAPSTSSVLSILKPPLTTVPGTTSAENITTTASINFNFSTAAPLSTSTTTSIASVALPPGYTTATTDPIKTEKKTTPKKVSFALPTSTTATTVPLLSTFANPTPTASSINFINPSTSVATTSAGTTASGFSFGGPTNNAPIVSSAGPGFSFGAPSTATTTTSGFNLTAISKPPQNIATANISLTASSSTIGNKQQQQQQQPIAAVTSVQSAQSLFAPSNPITTTNVCASANLFTGFQTLPQTTTAAASLPSFNNISSTAGINFGISNKLALPTAGLLNANIASTTTNNIFGAPPPSYNSSVTTTNSIPVPSFSLGLTNKTAAIPANIFGAPAPISQPSAQQPPANLFGAPSKTTVTGSGFPFNPTVATTSAATSSTGFNFGTAAPAATKTAQPSVFGAPPPSALSVFGNAPTSQISFGAPPASSTSFGAQSTSSTAGSVFGNTAANQNMFGAPTTSSNTAATMFKPTGPSSGFNFGTTSTATTKPGFSFGASSATTTTASGSIFGQATTAAASVFGQPAPAAAAPSGFGQSTTTASVFGQPAATSAVPAFGQASSTAASIFGQPSNASSSNVFGAPPAASAPIFGAPSAAPTPFGSNNKTASSVFGAPSNTAPAANPFGQSTQQSNFNNFNASVKPGSGFGAASSTSNNAFGTPAKPSFNFGGDQSSVPSFGATPSAPSFGTPQPPSFGTPQASTFGAPPAFNAPNAGGSGFTIGAGGGNQPRTTQRARRRLRK